MPRATRAARGPAACGRMAQCTGVAIMTVSPSIPAGMSGASVSTVTSSARGWPSGALSLQVRSVVAGGKPPARGVGLDRLHRVSWRISEALMSGTMRRRLQSGKCRRRKTWCCVYATGRAGETIVP